MVTFLREICKISQFLKLEHRFRKVFVHMPHGDHEAELIQMWFSNHLDRVDHRRALAFWKTVRAPTSTIYFMALVANSLCSSADGAFGDSFAAGSKVSHNSL
jgi:hypothetical protein